MRVNGSRVIERAGIGQDPDGPATRKKQQLAEDSARCSVLLKSAIL